MSRAVLTFVTTVHSLCQSGGVPTAHAAHATHASHTAQGIRARNRAALEDEILRAARAHLATDGAAGLSLRAIARDVGMVSSAIYRYVASRDELLTRLIVSGYESLAEAVTAAHAAVDPADLSGRWTAVGRSLRAWALEHPHDWALLYGSPVPDYAAPADRTTEPGTRVTTLLIQLLADAATQGRLARDAFTPHLTEDLGPQARAAATPLLDDPAFAAAGLDEDTIMSGLSAWLLLVGAINSEVFGYLGAQTFPQPELPFTYFLEVGRRLVLRD
jgi:AcrR family transcriptional regulator